MSAGTPATGTLSMTAAMVLRTSLQVVLFLAVASSLGAAGYGSFAAVLAVFTIANPLVVTGPALALSQAVLRRELPAIVAAGSGLVVIALCGAALLAVAWPVAAAVLPGVSGTMLLAIGIAELGCVPVAELLGRLFQATGAPVLLPGLAALVTGLRLALFGGWFAWSLQTGARLEAEHWAFLYAAASAVAAVLSIALFAWRRGLPAWQRGAAGASFRSGLPLAASGSAIRAYADADKTILARLADAASAGWFSVGSRVTELVMLPALARVEVILPRLIQAGAGGRAAVWRVARHELTAFAIINVLGGGGMLVLAPLLPHVVGASYAGAVAVLQSLCLLPLVGGLRALLRYVLLGAGMAGSCAKLDVGAALASVALNVALVPTLGWKGAVLTAYITGVAGVLLALVLIRGAGSTAANRFERRA